MFLCGLDVVIDLNEHGLMVSTFKTCKADSPLVWLQAKEKVKGEFSFVLVEALPLFYFIFFILNKGFTHIGMQRT